MPGESICGAKGFHLKGMWGVVFVAGGGWPVIVTTETVEPTTGILAFWASVPPGPVTATAIGMDGGRRDLGTHWVGPGAGAVRVVRGRTLRADDPLASGYVGSGAVWFDRCTFIGDYRTKAHPIGGNVGPAYFTNCTFIGCHRAQGGTPNNAMMRGCRIETTREDAVQGCPLLVDVTISGIDPGSTGEHADAVQLGLATHENVIYYRVKATDLHYQSLFIRGAGVSRGLAVVDCTFSMALPLRMPGAAGCAITGQWDHVIIRDSVFINPYGDVNSSAGFALWQEKDSAGVKRFALANSIVEGCTFGSWAIGPAVKDAIPSGTFKRNKWGTAPERDGLP